MNVALDTFESKIDQVLALCRKLSAENQEMRQRIAALESEREALTQKVNSARMRLESLIDKLPQT